MWKNEIALRERTVQIDQGGALVLEGAAMLLIEDGSVCSSVQSSPGMCSSIKQVFLKDNLESLVIEI